MKNSKIFLIVSIYLLFQTFSNCNDPVRNEEDQRIINKAAKIHQAAMKTHEEVMTDMDKLKKIVADIKERNKDTIQFESKKEEMKTLLTAFDKNLTDMDEWMKNIVEVPGYVEHEHKEGEEHHHHAHKEIENLTASEILEIQKEMKSEIDKIKKDLTETLNKFEKLLRKND